MTSTAAQQRVALGRFAQPSGMLTGSATANTLRQPTLAACAVPVRCVDPSHTRLQVRCLPLARTDLDAHIEPAISRGQVRDRWRRCARDVRHWRRTCGAIATMNSSRAPRTSERTLPSAQPAPTRFAAPGGMATRRSGGAIGRGCAIPRRRRRARGRRGGRSRGSRRRDRRSWARCLDGIGAKPPPPLWLAPPASSR